MWFLLSQVDKGPHELHSQISSHLGKTPGHRVPENPSLDVILLPWYPEFSHSYIHGSTFLIFDVLLAYIN